MRFDKFSFGSIQIDGSTYEHDVIIDRGEIRKRKKKPSKKFREQFIHEMVRHLLEAEPVIRTFNVESSSTHRIAPGKAA